MRLDMLTHAPSRKVLEAVAQMSNWGAPLPEGLGLGVAFVLSFGVPVATVLEISEQSGRIKLHNAYLAAGVGKALDPRNVEAQVFGGFNYGLAAAMMGEITVKDG